MNAKEAASLLQEGSHAGLFVCSTACRSCMVADARLSAVSWPARQQCGSIVSCQFIAVACLGHSSGQLYHHFHALLSLCMYTVLCDTCVCSWGCQRFWFETAGHCIRYACPACVIWPRATAHYTCWAHQQYLSVGIPRACQYMCARFPFLLCSLSWSNCRR